jgi:hypothetical protein
MEAQSLQTSVVDAPLCSQLLLPKVSAVNAWIPVLSKYWSPGNRKGYSLIRRSHTNYWSAEWKETSKN